MKTFDEMVKMSDTELQEYLDSEVENLISKASSRNVLRLRAIQAKCDNIRKTVKNPMVRASKIYGLMIDSFMDFNDKMQNASHLLKDIMRKDTPKVSSINKKKGD